MRNTRFLIFINDEDPQKAKWLWDYSTSLTFERGTGEKSRELEIYKISDYAFGVNEWSGEAYLHLVLNQGIYPDGFAILPVFDVEKVSVMFASYRELLAGYREFIWLTEPYPQTREASLTQKAKEELLHRIRCKIFSQSDEHFTYQLNWEETAVMRDLEGDHKSFDYHGN